MVFNQVSYSIHMVNGHVQYPDQNDELFNLLTIHSYFNNVNIIDTPSETTGIAEYVVCSPYYKPLVLKCHTPYAICSLPQTVSPVTPTLIYPYQHRRIIYCNLIHEFGPSTSPVCSFLSMYLCTVLSDMHAELL